MKKIILCSFLLMYGFVTGCGGENNGEKKTQNIKYSNIGQVIYEKNIKYKYDKNGNLIALKRSK